jgi:hypothetical protein
MKIKPTPILGADRARKLLLHQIAFYSVVPVSFKDHLVAFQRVN